MMWLVEVALRRPISVAVMALLMLVLGVALFRADERRHFSGDQHPGGDVGVELPRFVGGRYGAARWLRFRSAL